jgi:hypothetical protein
MAGKKRRDDLDGMGPADLVKLAEHHKVEGAAQSSAEELREAIRARRAESPPVPAHDGPIETVIDPKTGDHLFAAPPKPPEPAPAAMPLRAGPQRYLVTKTMRFAREGTAYTLHGGSVVSEMTHNLDELRRQGAQLHPCTTVEVVRGDLGQSVTLVDGKPSTDWADKPAPLEEVIRPNMGQK